MRCAFAWDRYVYCWAGINLVRFNGFVTQAGRIASKMESIELAGIEVPRDQGRYIRLGESFVSEVWGRNAGGLRTPLLLGIVAWKFLSLHRLRDI
jgi:hypothetical protein